MLSKIITDKIKKNIRTNTPIPIHEVRSRIAYTRLTKQDASMILKEMRKDNIIRIKNKYVYFR